MAASSARPAIPPTDSTCRNSCSLLRRGSQAKTPPGAHPHFHSKHPHNPFLLPNDDTARPPPLMPTPKRILREPWKMHVGICSGLSGSVPPHHLQKNPTLPRSDETHLPMPVGQRELSIHQSCRQWGLPVTTQRSLQELQRIFE